MSRPVTTAAAFCFLTLAGYAQAEELPPLVVPEGLPAPAEGTPASAADLPAATADDATATATGEATPVVSADTAIPATDTTTMAVPELTAPAIDARVDLSLPTSDFDSLGYPDHANGYRFIVSFRLEGVGGDRWSVAPEIGYFRMGQSERKVITLIPNTPPNFDLTRTDTYKLDASSLDFGVRLGRNLRDRIEAYARGGLAVTHTRLAQETLDHAEPKPGNPADPYDTRLTTPATTNVSADPYAAVGLAFKLGQVPSVYAEYGLRTIDGSSANSLAIGLLLDF